jgi:hypothetical protein
LTRPEVGWCAKRPQNEAEVRAEPLTSEAKLRGEAAEL